MSKKFVLSVMFVMVLLMSGCSSGGINFGGGDKVDRSGDGLELEVSMDDKWIHTGEIHYSVKVKNTGEDSITLSRENLDIDTVEKTKEGGNIFTRESIDNFYQNVLSEEGELKLYKDQSKGPVTGALKIKESFMENPNIKNINYLVKVEYPYTTEFSNNVEIDLNSEDLLTVREKVGQAAPVEVTDITLSPSTGQKYYLRFFIEDTGPRYSSNFISIEDISAKFRTESLSRCDVEVKQGDSYKKVNDQDIYLSEDRRQLIYTCPVNLENLETEEAVKTQVSGSFDYRYSVKRQGEISLPQQTNDQGFE